MASFLYAKTSKFVCRCLATKVTFKAASTPDLSRLMVSILDALWLICFSLCFKRAIYSSTQFIKHLNQKQLRFDGWLDMQVCSPPITIGKETRWNCGFMFSAPPWMWAFSECAQHILRSWPLCVRGRDVCRCPSSYWVSYVQISA